MPCGSVSGEVLARSGLSGGELLQTAVGPVVIVLVPPRGEDLLRVLDRQEVVLRKTLTSTFP